MNPNTPDGGELGRHFVIQKSITIAFKKQSRRFDKLHLNQVLWDPDGSHSITTVLDKWENVDAPPGFLSRHWTLRSKILLFPGDAISFPDVCDKGRSIRNLFRNNRKDDSRTGQEEFRIEYNDIVDLHVEQRSRETIFRRGHWTLTLHISKGNINDVRH
ncbi:hypothetical protein SCHPADRAFT_657823 [Schizopora paradoxa]|uniref:Uncharacterized protein n=1 Tax=Schizopora paradoxa TaxID=27342 RepID=A0A0H2R7A5_9AGAM|nr:hypothetical protein SCHPADRAFT_657823 [Schizopora paradoxa]